MSYQKKSRWIKFHQGQIVRLDDTNEHQKWINDKRINKLRENGLISEVYTQNPIS